MSKVKFNADEMMVMAMFEQPTRTETMRYIEEVVPFVEDDAEVFPLVASTMKKMRSISDIFGNFCGNAAGRKIGNKLFAHDNALPQYLI